MAVATVPTVARLSGLDDTRRRVTIGVAVVVSVLGGTLAGALGSSGHLLTVLFVAAIALPFVFWRVPASGVVVLLGCATTIEQFRYSVGSSTLDAFTDRIPVFSSLSEGLNLSGFQMNPFEVALLMVTLIWLMRAIAARTVRLTFPRSRVSAAIGLLMALTVIAIVKGLTSGGDGRAALWEVRPWFYLGLTYLVASQVLTSRKALNAVLWTIVAGTGFKAVQGVIILYQARNLSPKPEQLLGHEEAFFFGLFIMLTIGLWIFGQRGRLRTVATTLAPLVILADLGNYRRVAWLILGADLIVMMVLAYTALPERRRLLRRIAAGIAVASLFYFPLFWNSDGTLAQPARAVRSAISPDVRDMQSNLYRKQEDANLGVNIQRSMPLGMGFGIPIDYSSTAIVDITGISFVAYVPHDGILYVWMRMGLAGELALWFFVAAAVFAGARAARSPDKMVGLLGAMVACAAVAWVLMGQDDMGFFWFRIAAYFGCLLGLLHAATKTDRVKAPAKAAAAPVRLRPVHSV